MKNLLLRRWFLIALVVVLVGGAVFAVPLKPIVELKPLRNAIVATVLFLMALPLKASAMWRVMRRPWAPLLAVLVNFGLLPLFAWGVSLGLSRDMAAGLLVAAATPCTLASASVWTRRAGGNDSAAIMVTVITNLACFVVTPLWLTAMTGRETNSAALDLGAMIVKLGLLVVLPMAAAQVVRLYDPVGSWATENKSPLGVAAQCGVLSMVFFGAVNTGLRLAGSGGSAVIVADLLWMIGAVVLIHLTMFTVGMTLARLLRLQREDCIAVGFAGSQKTLMVGLQVGLDLGFSILPMVAYHVSQLFVDTIIADRLRQTSDSAAGPPQA